MLTEYLNQENTAIRNLFVAFSMIAPTLLWLVALGKLARFLDSKWLKTNSLKPYRTALHQYPKLVGFIQIMVMFWIPVFFYNLTKSILNNPIAENVSNPLAEEIVAPVAEGVIVEAEMVIDETSKLINWEWIFKHFHALFGIIKAFSFLTAVFSFGGMLFPTFGTRSKNKKNYDEKTLVVFRWVTRGISPDLVRTNIRNNWKILKNYSNFKLEVVTDKKIGIQPELYGIPSGIFSELVVPDSYKTPNNSLFKARALYFAAVYSKLATPGSYVFHCDEESTVTEQLAVGVREFITNHYGKIGQGIITYRNDEYSLSSYLCHFADAVRVGDDIGRFRLQLRLLGKAYFGLKGSFVLIPNDIETEHSTSFDCCGTLGSITEDSWWAFTQNMNENKFAWCNGTLVEQSPFTINDLRKQRKRWVSGLISVLFYHPCPIKDKMILAIQLFGWCLLPIFALFTWTDIVLFGAGSQQSVLYNFNLFELSNAFGYIVFMVLYVMGNLILVHKNYLEKIVITMLFPTLLPLTVCFEASGVLSGILWPDKCFGLIQKEGNKVNRNKKLLNKPNVV